MAYDIYNPTVKSYTRDIDRPIPNVEYCGTDLPRLRASQAPYLPLQRAIDKHDTHYVCLPGKVAARDSYGFLVPAGYALEQETAAALANFGTGNVDFVAADLIKYTAEDVAAGVVNSRGVLCAVGEPVVYSMIRKGGLALPNFALGVAGTSTAVPTAGVITWAITIGDHIGVCFNPWLRSSTDNLSRAANSHIFYPGSATGMDARIGEDDGSLLRHEAVEHQMKVSTVRTNYCLVLPVVADRTGVLITGQAVAIGASMSAFGLGDRVTFNRDSDIVPATIPAVTVGSLAGNDAADLLAVQAAVDSVILKMGKWHRRIVGQVIKKESVFPRALLDKVKTRWGSDIPGFDAIDRMPGSATGGYPDHLYTAGSTMGEIVVSLFMR